MFKDYFPLIMLVVGIGIGYLLNRSRKKEIEETEAKKGPARRKERLDYDVVVMEEDRK